MTVQLWTIPQITNITYQPTFNPVDKVVELYERLLKEKDAEIESLKKQAGKKK